MTVVNVIPLFSLNYHLVSIMATRSYLMSCWNEKKSDFVAWQQRITIKRRFLFKTINTFEYVSFKVYFSSTTIKTFQKAHKKYENSWILLRNNHKNIYHILFISELSWGLSKVFRLPINHDEVDACTSMN